MRQNIELHRTEGSVFVNVPHPSAPPRNWTAIATEIAVELPPCFDPITDAIADFNVAWHRNRDRLLGFLRADLEVSDGILLSELGVAISIRYNARAEMSVVEWHSLAVDLFLEFSTVDWITDLQELIHRKYEDRKRKPDLKGLLAQVDALLGVSAC